ncbi:MAG: flagellar hook-length control protein FliK [Betaproteobacteria bacterium]|nr:flagellar hook-length control protein FliK [Betaproteobacteria bacterium]
MLTGPEAIGLAGGRLNPIYLEGRLLPVFEQVGRELDLAPNQVVSGVVESRAEGLVLLLRGQAIELGPQSRLRPGDVVSARVVETPNGLALSPLPPPAASQAQAADSIALATAALAQSNIAAAGSAAMSPSIAAFFARSADLSVIAQILSSPLLPKSRLSMGRLSADGVRWALRASGLLTEARLRSGASIEGDLKQLLTDALRSLNADAQSNPEVREAMNSALREIQSAQADAYAAHSNKELLASFVIPFRDASPVAVRFFRGSKTDEQPNPPMTIDIHTDSPSLGELWLSAKVQLEKRLELSMWADREDVATRARKAVSELREDLEQAGLSLEQMTIIHGRKPESLDLPQERALAPGYVLDLKA